MLLTVPGNEGRRGAVVQQSNRGRHLLSGQVQLTGNLGISMSIMVVNFASSAPG